MNFNYFRILLAISHLFFYTALCDVSIATAADYATLVNSARAQLESDKYIEALATAKDAVRAKPNDFLGHYYVAMAFMGMGRFDDAETSVSRALQLVPESKKTGVEKLARTINTRRHGTTSGQEADAAFAEGLIGKAAILYEQAWAAGKEKPELGLKAANLYVERLNQPVDAARVLRQVKEAAVGNPAADQADAELKKISETLRQIAKANVDATHGMASCDDALVALQKAEDADPTYEVIYLERAHCASGKLAPFENAIKDLAKHNLASPESLSKLNNMSFWIGQPAFTQFLGDLIGKGQVDILNALIRDRPIKEAREAEEKKAAAALLEQKKKAEEALIEQKKNEEAAHRADENRFCENEEEAINDLSNKLNADLRSLKAGWDELARKKTSIDQLRNTVNSDPYGAPGFQMMLNTEQRSYDSQSKDLNSEKYEYQSNLKELKSRKSAYKNRCDN